MSERQGGESGRARSALALAAWAGLAFGLAEGAVLVVTRQFPKLRAPYKVSVDILWAAPLLHIVLYAALALLMWAVFRALARSRTGAYLRWYARTLLFVGAVAVLNAPGVLHPASVVVLAAGLAVAVGSRVRSDEQLAQRLGRRVLVVPIAILLIAAGTSAWRKGREAAAVRALPAATAGAPNVLFVIFDTLRRDRIEDADPALAPALQQVAELGVRYTNAWAASSWSLPSHATLLTGSLPEAHGADWPELRLGPDQPTLPQVLAAHGYVTGSFSGNANWMTPEYLGRGFHRFDVYTLEQLLLRTTFGGAISDLALKRLGIHPAGRGKKAPRLADELLEFVDDYAGRPYFAYVTFMDVNQAFHRTRHGHRFWQSAAPTADIMASYDAGLKRLDAQFAQLLDELRARGHLDNTILVVTSDHGESFGVEAGDHDPAGHATSLYPEQTRVPLMIVYPAAVPAGTRVHTTVSLRAIAGTIADLAGLDPGVFGEPLPLATVPGAGEAFMTLRYGDRQAEAVVRGTRQTITVRTADGPVREVLDLDSVSASRGARAGGSP
ncbi:MAG TPA: sulfatase [Longimicrobiales bacterium]